jgi:hypothetical protein
VLDGVKNAAKLVAAGNWTANEREAIAAMILRHASVNSE